MTQLKGFVTHIIYRNNGNGYTVFELNTGDEITCVGTFQSLEEGEILELEGDFTEHAVYGSQFKVSSFKFSSPEDAAGMERYLGSGAIKGVGASLAARIVKRFGADTFRIIEEEPERLAEIKGISERKAMDIASQMEEKHEMREAMVYLQKYGISNTLAVRIYETYGSRLFPSGRPPPPPWPWGRRGKSFSCAIWTMAPPRRLQPIGRSGSGHKEGGVWNGPN